MGEQIPEKIIPKKNCINFWESMLFHNKAFLPVETIIIIQATIKHLQSKGVMLISNNTL